eukprot:3326018-Pyramimonas_sp.AAC.2
MNDRLVACAKSSAETLKTYWSADILRDKHETGLHLAALGPDNIICGIIASQWLLTLFVHALPDGNASRRL